ncbi:MAG: outer membrane beta-barrel protein [Candidatus Zixiibacteriota bacterium]
MFKTVSTGMLLGALMLMPLSARGQTNAYLGPHLGIQNSSDAENANYLVGATLRLKLIPVIGIEGDIGYRQSKFGEGALTVRQWPATATALLYPLPFLYGGIGGGWYNTTIDYADRYNDVGIDDETTTEFGWHLAAGLEIPASPRFKLFGDIRFVFLDYKFKELPEAVLDGADSDFYSINLGVLFQL